MTEFESQAISYVFKSIDQVGAQLVAHTYRQLVLQYASVFYILTGIFIGFCFIHMQRGKMTGDDFVMNLFRAVLILTLALNYDAFCLFLYNVFTNAPLHICQAITIDGNHTNVISVSQALDQFLQQGEKAAANIWLMGSWANPTYLIFSGLIYILVMLTAAIAAGLIVLSKCASTVLFSLSPIFIFFALFNTTKGIFESFIGQLMTYALIPIMSCAILMMLLSVCDIAIKNFNQHAEPNFISLVPLSLICVIQIYLLLQVKAKCASLAGGISLPSVVSTLRSGAQNAKGVAHGAMDVMKAGPSGWRQAQKAMGIDRSQLSRYRQQGST